MLVRDSTVMESGGVMFWPDKKMLQISFFNANSTHLQREGLQLALNRESDMISITCSGTSQPKRGGVEQAVLQRWWRMALLETPDSKCI